jgi:hypothetical protein
MLLWLRAALFEGVRRIFWRVLLDLLFMHPEDGGAAEVQGRVDLH